MILVALLYFLFASVFVVAKVGLEVTSPLFFVGIRMLLAGLLLLGFLFFKERRQLSIPKDAWFRLFLLALVNIYLTNVLEFWGLQHLTSFKSCFIYSLSPFLSALFSYFLFSERLNAKKWVGLIVGFLGFLPILLDGTPEEGVTGSLLGFSWAEMAAIGAAVFSVYGWIILKQLVQENKLSPLLSNGVSMFIGGSFALLHSFYVENWNPLPVSYFPTFLEAAIYLIIISNLVCYNLYGYLLKRFSATFMSFAGFLTPFFAATMGWFFLSETISYSFVLSYAIVFSGLFLFYAEELKTSSVQIAK